MFFLCSLTAVVLLHAGQSILVLAFSFFVSIFFSFFPVLSSAGSRPPQPIHISENDMGHPSRDGRFACSLASIFTLCRLILYRCPLCVLVMPATNRKI
jgi:hypothetical protein